MDITRAQSQVSADGMAWFPDTAPDVVFNTMGLAGEAGEVANMVKKMMRGDFDLDVYSEEWFDISDELADVFIYLMKLATALDIDLEDAWLRKRAQLVERWGPAPMLEADSPA